MSAEVSRPVTTTKVHPALRALRIRAILDGKKQASRRPLMTGIDVRFRRWHAELSGIAPQYT
jgi:hypothetical protein